MRTFVPTILSLIQSRSRLEFLETFEEEEEEKNRGRNGGKPLEGSSHQGFEGKDLFGELFKWQLRRCTWNYWPNYFNQGEFVASSCAQWRRKNWICFRGSTSIKAKVVEETTIDNSPATVVVTVPPCSQTFIEGLANDVPERTSTPFSVDNWVFNDTPCLVIKHGVGSVTFPLNTSGFHNAGHAQASVHSAISTVDFKEARFIEDLWE